MAQTIEEAVIAIQNVAEGLPGMKGAPDYPPEKLPGSAFPFAISYAGTVNYQGQSEGWMKGFHTIITEIHVQRKELPKDVKLITPFAKLFANDIWGDVHLDETVETVLDVRGSFTPLDWGKDHTLGWIFETDIKQIHTIT